MCSYCGARRFLELICILIFGMRAGCGVKLHIRVGWGSDHRIKMKDPTASHNCFAYKVSSRIFPFEVPSFMKLCLLKIAWYMSSMHSGLVGLVGA